MNKICEWYKALFKIKTQKIPRIFLQAIKKSHLNTRVMAHTVLLNCPIKPEIKAVDNHSDLRILFCYSYDYV